MKKKTILFFPVEIGLAHIARSLAVAEELQSRGHKVIFTLPKRKHTIFKNSPVQLVDIKSFIEEDELIKIRKFSNFDFLNNRVQEELAIIRHYKPDAVVVDYRISALAAAKISGVKTYALFHGSSLPYGSYLPNPGLPYWFYKTIESAVHWVFNVAIYFYLKPLLKIVRLHKIKTDFDQWFHSITYILPEPSFYFPALSKNLDLHYVSPLSWPGFNSSPPPWLSNINADGKTIYLSFGGTGFDEKKLIELSLKLAKNHYRVIVSTGTIADPKDFPKLNNLYVERFLPGKIISSKVDLVVCHGGYGTTIEAIGQGKPVLVIPFNPDQIIHAWRMKELGVARCLFKIDLKDIFNIFTFDWKKIEDKGKNIDVEQVLTEVKYMFKHLDNYKKSIDEFNKKYPDKNGAKQAADIIE